MPMIMPVHCPHYQACNVILWHQQQQHKKQGDNHYRDLVGPVLHKIEGYSCVLQGLL